MALQHHLLIFISAFASGNDGAIHAYHLDLDTGQLELVQRTTDAEHPFFMALSPDYKYLYAIHAPGQFGGEAHEQVAAYAIAGSKGRLKLLNRQSALGSAACYLDVDATGRTVVVANYATGSVAALPVREDGSLGKAASFIQHEGSSVDESRQQGPHAHSIVVSPDNRFVYAADLGLDQVLGYRLEAGAARLSPHPQPFVRTAPGAGPRHLTFHPNGRAVYVINELDNSITMFDYISLSGDAQSGDAQSGDTQPGNSQSGMLIERQTLSTLPEDFDGKSHCADLKITPDGRRLYGTNRGHDSIAAYGIGDDGRLTLLGIQPSLGKGPQNLAITPGGEFLLCANMPGNSVALFRIDPETGGLTQVGEPVSMPSPSCIMLAE